jgi:hypothetical protein
MRAVDLQIASLAIDRTVPALVVGHDLKAIRTAIALSDRGRRVIVIGVDRDAMAALVRPAAAIESAVNAAAVAPQAGVVVAFARGAIGAELIDALPVHATVFDAGIGALTPDAIARATARGIRVVRPDMRAALAAELSAAAGTRRVATELMGRGEIDGVAVVAGGLIGAAGDVVVDSISNPTRALGVATGDGAVNYAPGTELAERMARVQRAIWRRKLGAEAD